jgi:hypothetical protein
MRLFIVVLLLFAATGSFAQTQKPWQPFPFGQVGYYADSSGNPGNDGSTFRTISLDSLQVIGVDSFYFFNRKLFSGEPLCTQPGSSLWREHEFPNGLFGIQSDSLRISGDTVWLPSDSVIIPWIFNKGLDEPLNQVQICGGKFFKYSAQWFDYEIMDSVRSISVYNSASPNSTVYAEDELRMSKHHGFVKTKGLYTLDFCETLFTGEPVMLVGTKTDTTAWGFKVPESSRYFPYTNGDIIKWHQGSTNGSSYTIRDSVMDVEYSGDTIAVQWRRVTRNTSINPSVDIVTTPLEYFITHDYDWLFTRTTNLPCIEPAYFPGVDPNRVTALTALVKRLDGCPAVDTIFYIDLQHYFLDNDSCYLIDASPTNTFDEFNIIQYHYQYSAARGFDEYFHVHTYGGAGNTYVDYTSKYQLGYFSPSRGFACGDWFGLSNLNLQPADRITLSPNPASATIELTFHRPVSGTLNVLDATGRLIQTQQLAANDLVMLDVSALSPSIYFIHVLANDSVYTCKFVKQ